MLTPASSNQQAAVVELADQVPDEKRNTTCARPLQEDAITGPAVAVPWSLMPAQCW